MSNGKGIDLSFVSLFLCALIILLGESEKTNFAVPLSYGEFKRLFKFLAKNQVIFRSNFKIILPNRRLIRRRFQFSGAYFGNVPQPIIVYSHE
jgi:hypothetical protein